MIKADHQKNCIYIAQPVGNMYYFSLKKKCDIWIATVCIDLSVLCVCVRAFLRF